MTNTWTIKKVANLIFVTDETNQIWKSWNVEDFTERKLNNYIKKLRGYYKYEINVINKLA